MLRLDLNDLSTIAYVSVLNTNCHWVVFKTNELRSVELFLNSFKTNALTKSSLPVMSFKVSFAILLLFLLLCFHCLCFKYVRDAVA